MELKLKGWLRKTFRSKLNDEYNKKQNDRDSFMNSESKNSRFPSDMGVDISNEKIQK